MVWDMGTWEPLGDADAMLAKGDLRFRLHGKKLNGEFVLAHMRSRRSGSKGTEWLLIKKRDEAVQEGFDIDEFDYSVTTNRSLAEIAGDSGSREWQSNRKAAVKKGAEWLLEDEDKEANTAPAKAKKAITKQKATTIRKKSLAKTSSAKTKPRNASRTKRTGRARKRAA